MHMHINACRCTHTHTHVGQCLKNTQAHAGMHACMILASTPVLMYASTQASTYVRVHPTSTHKHMHACMPHARKHISTHGHAYAPTHESRCDCQTKVAYQCEPRCRHGYLLRVTLQLALPSYTNCFWLCPVRQTIFGSGQLYKLFLALASHTRLLAHTQMCTSMPVCHRSDFICASEIQDIFRGQGRASGLRAERVVPHCESVRMSSGQHTTVGNRK